MYLGQWVGRSNQTVIVDHVNVFLKKEILKQKLIWVLILNSSRKDRSKDPKEEIEVPV